MNRMKQSIVLTMILIFLTSLCCAGAETAGTEEIIGIWYLNAVRIDSETYDVSRSSERVTIEFDREYTGLLRISSEKEQEPLTWSQDETGTLFCSYADADSRSELMKINFGENCLIVSSHGEDYYFTREEAERSDIPYGMIAEFVCEMPDHAGDSNEELLENTAAVIRQRLKEEGYSIVGIYHDGTNRITVEIPGVQDEALLDLISARGEVRFMDPDNNLIMTGDQIETAVYCYEDGKHEIAFELTEEGRALFAEATTKNLGRNIRIILDDEILIDATVQTPITEGRGVITGSYTQEQAMNIAAKIQSGPLPAALILEESAMITDKGHAESLAAAGKAEREDAETVILKLGDNVITKAEVKAATESVLYEQEQMYYYYYGITLDVTDPSVISEARSIAVAQLKQDMVLRAKAKELGLDQLTEEETAEAQESAQSSLDYAKSYVQSYMLTEEQQQLEGEELDAVIQESLDALGVSYETYEKNAVDTVVDNKLRAYAIKDVTVPDEDVKAEYNTRAAKDEETYREDADAWTRADRYGSVLYYSPAGVRRVKQILLKFKADDQTAIDDANDKVKAAETKVSEAERIVNDPKAAEAQTVSARADLKAAQEELEAAQSELAAVRETAFRNLDEDADAILEALKENPDSWDRLMEEKNEDTGLKAGAVNAEKGYAICEGMTGFDTAFVDAAMALQSVGENSGKVRGESYGYYIIRYVSDVAEGPADYDSVKDIIYDDLLSEKQEKTYTDTVSQWIGEASVWENLDALKD